MFAEEVLGTILGIRRVLEELRAQHSKVPAKGKAAWLEALCDVNDILDRFEDCSFNSFYMSAAEHGELKMQSTLRKIHQAMMIARDRPPITPSDN